MKRFLQEVEELEVYLGEFTRLNSKFAHEIYLGMNEGNFEDIMEKYDLILYGKWAEYCILN